MNEMLTQICQELKNYFLKSVHPGTYTIENGVINGADGFLIPGQYFRIVGSVLNDGVHQYPASELNDETFEGSIWAMAVPQAVVALSDEIDKWITDNAEVLNSPYTSESFGGYSYSKASGAGYTGSAGYSWENHFASQLNRWRKIHV